jgi:hypothetical protein
MLGVSEGRPYLAAIELRAPALHELVEVLGLQQFVQSLIERVPGS